MKLTITKKTTSETTEEIEINFPLYLKKGNEVKMYKDNVPDHVECGLCYIQGGYIRGGYESVESSMRYGYEIITEQEFRDFAKYVNGEINKMIAHYLPAV